MSEFVAPIALRATIEQWPLITPFHITGFTWEALYVLLVTLECDGRMGRGEASGVYYRQETPATMLRQIESLRTRIEPGITRHTLSTLLPPGGARNALDCALWDLEAKLSGRPVWQIAGLEEPRPLRATFTCGADTPERMAETAVSYKDAQAIKIKLTGDPLDEERVRAVRSARADVWLGVDANQGFTRVGLERLMPVLVDARVALIEQPFPVGQESLLDGFYSPIPVAADESAQGLAALDALAERFDVINIKLDKCGGLTDGMTLARRVRALGLEPMAGNMLGTSLAMAPGYLLGQLCSVVDLDGPIALRADRVTPVIYKDGHLTCPVALWGYPASATT
jgi:L-Ala-D/L-Glu epimerase / N-acetyl-D-glutamate racemase